MSSCVSQTFEVGLLPSPYSPIPICNLGILLFRYICKRQRTHNQSTSSLSTSERKRILTSLGEGGEAEATFTTRPARHNMLRRTSSLHRISSLGESFTRSVYRVTILNGKNLPLT